MLTDTKLRTRRLCATLHAKGVKEDRYRVRRLMRRQGLQARWKRKSVKTTNSHGFSVRRGYFSL